MKQYNNGQRKGMMYGGMPRKPMMYGGKAKKMQMGGTAPKKNNAMQQNATSMPMTSPMMPAQPMPTAQQRTPMAEGGRLKMVEKNGKKVPFYAADGVGKMKHGGKAKKSGY